MLTCLGGAMIALGVGACGGEAGEAEVGDCIDAENNVVDCDSPSATHELVSDQSEPNPVSCVVIREQQEEQVTVTVDDTVFCAKEK